MLSLLNTDSKFYTDKLNELKMLSAECIFRLLNVFPGTHFINS